MTTARVSCPICRRDDCHGCTVTADWTATPDDPDRQAWLDWRREGIGASDVAAIARVEGAFGTPYAVWLSKVHGIDGDSSEAMEWGNLIEGVILDEVERRTGLTVAARQLRLTHPDAPHHRCTLDGAAFAADAVAGATEANLDVDWSELLVLAACGVEAKNTSYRNYPNDEPPLNYYVQAQWQCWVGHLDAVTLAVLHAGTRLALYDIPRNDDDIAVLVDAADRFWNDHVLTGNPPEFDAADLDLVRSWVGPATRDVRTADPATADLVALYAAAKAAAKAATDEADRLAAQLITAVGDAEVLIAPDGRPLLTFKASRRFDLDAAVAAHADAAAASYTLDVDTFKKAIGKKAVDQHMVANPGGARRLVIPKEKKQ